MRSLLVSIGSWHAISQAALLAGFSFLVIEWVRVDAAFLKDV